MSRKDQASFVCPACGYRSPRWMGFCPNCHEAPDGLVEWVPPATRLEAIIQNEKSDQTPRSVPISEVGSRTIERIPTGFSEVDRVLGGGLVPGSFVLLGGDPGVGKSTLILQALSRIARSRKVLIAAGEESPEQIRMRYDRLGEPSGALHLMAETDLEAVLAEVVRLSPEILVVDSIQTITMPQMGLVSGSVALLRESATLLLEVAKKSGVTVLVIGHVTKDGQIAGPRVLEHLVDTVLYLEGERHHPLRMLRSVKNRFGPTGELGIFEMVPEGLREVENPSSFFLEGRRPNLSGSIIVPGMEGSRPILVELQTLVNPTVFPNPRRVAQGVSLQRLSLMTAVLSRRTGLELGGMDLFVNIVGGVDVDEPAIDLPVALSLAGSFRNLALPSDWVVMGEVGLGGEVRRVPHLAERLKEAERHGFRHAILPGGSADSSKSKKDPLRAGKMGGLSFHPVTELREAIDLLKDVGRKG
ncbi:MAG: DNA repair protein RadA [Leptospirillum sp.]